MRVEGDYRPQNKEAAFNDVLPQAGNDQTGNVPNPFDALIQRPGLNLPDIDEYCMMWKGLAAFQEERGIQTTPEVVQMIGHISRGLDFVLFHKVSATQRGSILEEVRNDRQGGSIFSDTRREGTEQYVLTYEEGLILRDAAAAVKVAYDPGTPEEVEKRTFKIADLEQKAEYLEVI